MVNEELARTLAASCDEPLIVLDNERRVVAMTAGARNAIGELEAGRRLPEELTADHPGVLVLFLESPPELFLAMKQIPVDQLEDQGLAARFHRTGSALYIGIY